MKARTSWFIVACLSLGFASLLTGCSAETQSGVPGEYRTYKQTSVAVWIDPETKCEYISGSRTAAMTPRLDRQGRQICR